MLKSLRSHLSDPHVGLIDHENEKEVVGYSYAVSGVSFAAILALSCLSDVGCCLYWATVCFSVSFPASLAFSLFLRHVSIGGWSTRPSRILSVAVGLLVYLSVWAGIGLLVLHISGIAGVVFLVASVLGVGFSWSFAHMHGNTCARLSDHYGQDNLGPLPPLDPKE